MMNMAQANTNTNKTKFSYSSMFIMAAIFMILILNIVIMLTTLSSFFMLKNYQDVSVNMRYSSSPFVCEHEQKDVESGHTSNEIEKYLKLLNENIVSKRHIRIHKELGTIRREKRRLASYKRKEHINYLLLLKRKQFLELEVADLNRRKREILQEEAMTNYTQAATENGSDVLSLSTGLVCNNQNRLHNCLLSNTSLESKDNINYVDILIKFKLLRNNSVDYGHLLFEFGLVSKSVENDRYISLYSVKFRRCDHELGICPEIQDELSTVLKRNLTESTYGYTTMQFTIKVQNSFVVLFCKAQIIHISNFQNASDVGYLWPAVYVYNPHIVDASLSIGSKKNIGFDTKYSSPNLYLSTDNRMVSNWERNNAKDSILLKMIEVLEVTFIFGSIGFFFIIRSTDNKDNSKTDDPLLVIFLGLSFFLIGFFLCLYYIYMYLYWSLLFILNVSLGSVLYESAGKYKDMKMENVFGRTFTILAFSTFLTSLSHMIYILYINFLSDIFIEF